MPSAPLFETAEYPLVISEPDMLTCRVRITPAGEVFTTTGMKLASRGADGKWRLDIRSQPLVTELAAALFEAEFQRVTSGSAPSPSNEVLR